MRSTWDADQALPGELIQLYRGLFEQEMARWPTEIREVLIEGHLSREWLQAGLREASNVDQLYDEIRHAGPMPDLPLIILCSMETDGFKQAVSVGESESLPRQEIEGKQRLYTALADSVPRGEIRLVEAGMSPCTSAVPAPSCRRSRTCWAGDTQAHLNTSRKDGRPPAEPQPVVLSIRAIPEGRTSPACTQQPPRRDITRNRRAHHGTSHSVRDEYLFGARRAC
jgi:hypothetical protein